MNLILYAIPFFLLLICIEIIVDRVKGTSYYVLSDSLTSLATGSINQLVNASKALIPLAVYVLLYENLSIFNLGDSLLVWGVAFIAYDFCYYWNHRFGHEMNILWASHVVHHSSEEYNLTTALRQTGTSFLSVFFYLPLAVIGFDPLMIASVGALNLIYQFWVHTRHVGKLGWFEWFFVTPSNHRGHHAQNTVYIDRNYGGVFILWDRLFSTFQEELDDDLPIYGIRGAVQSWNPLWVNAQIYHQLFMDALHTKSYWYKATLWFRRTGWRPPDVKKDYPFEKPGDLADFVKYETFVPTALKIYCVLQYTAMATIGIGFALYASQMNIIEQVAVVFFALLSSFAIGALMESKHYSGLLEWLRLPVLIFSVVIFSLPSWMVVVLATTSLIGLPLLFLGRKEAVQNECLVE